MSRRIAQNTDNSIPARKQFERENVGEQEPKTIKQSKDEFEGMVKDYLESNPIMRTDRKVNELEIRFGTNNKLASPISKIDYDNVVKNLSACGFRPQTNDGIHLLRIQTEYFDPRRGMTIMSNIRAEIVGTDLIQEYCRTNNLQKVLDMPSNIFNKVKFTQKSNATRKDGSVIRKVDMDDFNFRVSYQLEQDYNTQSQIARKIIDKWIDSKKMFRCMNRVRFYHPDLPIFADLSIVKMSKKTNRTVIPQFTIQEAQVFNNIETYEIELEIDNSRVGTGTPFNSVESVMDALRKSIRVVLSGLQGSKFPISYVERNDVLTAYMKVVHGDKYEMQRRVLPRDFIGPGSYTLQLENVLPENELSTVPNIRKNYTVTEKADGDRKLLYISEIGKIYLIDTNMNVIFTGAKTAEKTIFYSLLDGEHIKYDKNGKYINLYMAFDIYFVNKKSIREFEFIPTREEETETKFRLPILQQLIELIKPISILDVSPSRAESGTGETLMQTGFRVQCKSFYMDSESVTIFEGCSQILSNIRDGAFEYNTDGLIFTPSTMSAGGVTAGTAGPLYKSTWDKSFKWKPAEFNTIDFLVSIKKDKTGKDEIHNIFQEGRNLQGTQDVKQYKTLILRCGFDERKHGYLNPCQDILNDKLPSPGDIDNEDSYKPVPFQPTNPYDVNACYCNVWLKEDGNRMFMMTEEDEYFEEDTIVEFKYAETNADGWKWIPLRVRYDKTSELRAGLKNYGNAYHVANNNWHSIHHPITEEMISSGRGIPEYATSEDVYYNRSSEQTSTKSLRDFHNLFVKNSLISAVVNRGDTIIDYAVGKAGDLSKWIRSRAKFVFGIDISKDNINNHIDGACARFLTARKKYSEMPHALFAVGNSSLNIREGKAFMTEKDKQMSASIFGTGPKDVNVLGKGVYNQYGVAENGFNVSSCQFAMHYFFENKATFHQFLRNIAECTKINGYFIGTCYDGETVFELLSTKQRGESITIMKDDRKIYEITKMYDETGFPAEEMSLGYAINVYQESINQSFREYLVNFEYLIRIMEDYGFVLVTKEEAQQKNMPNNTGLFSELFTHMENEIKRRPHRAADYGTANSMTPEEKRISFMNRYFIFKKVRNVDVKKLSEIILKQNLAFVESAEAEIEELKQQAMPAGEDITTRQEMPTVPQAVAIKLKKPRLVLKKIAPVAEVTEPALAKVGEVEVVRPARRLTIRNKPK